MRLIDAEQFLVFGYNGIPEANFADGVSYVLGKIDNAPTIDAVEVVRCKDCKFCERINVGLFEAKCGEFDLIRGLNDYCSRGKEKMHKKELPIAVEQQYKKVWNECVVYDQWGNKGKQIVESKEKDFASTNRLLIEQLKFALDKLTKESALDGNIMDISIEPHINIDGYLARITCEEK